MKQIFYLGKNDGVVRLALADLDDLTPRMVPVKHVPYAEFSRMRKDGSLDVVGFVDSGSPISNLTNVRVGIIKVAYKNRSHEILTDNIQIFISGRGQLRFFHPTYFDVLRGGVGDFLMRQNIVELVPETMGHVQQLNTFDTMYSEFFDGNARTADSREFFIQRLLSYGLFCRCEDTSSSAYSYYASTLDLTALGDYTIQNPYKVPYLDVLEIPESIRTLSMKNAVWDIGTVKLTKQLKLESGTHGLRVFNVGELQASCYATADFEGANLQRIVGLDMKYNGISHKSSGTVSGLDKYTGVDMLKDAGTVNLTYCFNGDGGSRKVIDNDVVIPFGASMNHCFRDVAVKGEVIFEGNNSCESSFSNSSCGSVTFKEDTGGRHVYRQIVDSFISTDIQGDLDISHTTRIVGSFTGNILGNISMCQNLALLQGECFTKSVKRDFVLNPVCVSDQFYTVTPVGRLGLNPVCVGDQKTAVFEGCLVNPKASLTVYGVKGTFKGVNVEKLTWKTEATAVPCRMFCESVSMLSEEVPSITVIEREAFENYAGKFIDFRMFPGLQKIQSRAVVTSQTLMAAIIDGDVELSPSVFVRCPRLTKIYIGDNVTGVSAGVFDNCATGTTIYYNENKAVERLGRLPRFSIVKGVPDDAHAGILDRQEQLESADVVAKIAGVESFNYKSVDAEQSSVMRAIGLSFMETGFNPDLATLYPVIPHCDISAESVPWAVNMRGLLNPKAYSLREGVARLLVAVITTTYPYCEAVLHYKGYTVSKDKDGNEKLLSKTPVGDVVLWGDGYQLIRTPFRVSGDTCYAYVVVELGTQNIIHAFTVGAVRDEVKECVDFSACVDVDTLPCAVLRYVEDAPLLEESQYRSSFTSSALKKMRAGVKKSWVPFGTFRVGSKYGVYGIDACNGDVVVFLMEGVKATAIFDYTWRSKDFSEVFISRFSPHGRKHTTGLGVLKPLFAGVQDESLTALVNNSKGAVVKTYDMGSIPLTADSVKLKRLYGVLGGMHDSQKYSVAEAAQLFADSELFRSGKRIQSNLSSYRTSEIGLVPLKDGSITFYMLSIGNLIYIELEQNSGKKATYSTPCDLNRLIAIIGCLVHNPKATIVNESNIEHFSIKRQHVGQIIKVATCGGTNYPTYHNNRLFLGISPVSHKACLYVLGDKLLDEDKAVVLFWFNSIAKACDAAASLNFNPFAMQSFTSKVACVSEGVDVNNALVTHKRTLYTQEAIIDGRPDGFISQNQFFYQEIFDVACKQPK